MHPVTPLVTDAQYAVMLCGSPLAEAAVHAGTNTAKLVNELTRTPFPAELRPFAVVNK